MDDLISSLLRRWTVDSIKWQPGVTSEQLLAFERRNRVALPDDLRAYLRRANGIGRDELDGLARLWPLDEYVRVIDFIGTERASVQGLSDPETFFCFGDYNVEGSIWAVRLTPSVAEGGEVRVFWTYANEGTVVAPSFEVFLRRYVLEGPDGMG